MSVIPTLDLLDHVTPALLDGPETTARCADSDSALRVTALNVSRMDTGEETLALVILMFI